MVTVDAVLLGGGYGKRFANGSATLPKQFQMLGTAPVFIHALKALLRMDCFRQVVMAFPEPLLDQAKELIDTYITDPGKTQLKVTAGGERRQDSSFLALEAVEVLHPMPTRVLIHDACRPFLSPGFAERIKQCLADRSYGAWVPVVPIVETLKKVENHQVVETIDRELIHRVQTPQVFEFPVIRLLAEKARRLELTFTDDASLCEYYGIPVGVFDGDPHNLKLTFDYELETLRHMMLSSDQVAGKPELTS